jgi:hypothetical protein
MANGGLLPAPLLVFSRLAAILKEQHFGCCIASVVKAKGAIATLVVLQHAATGATTVHLVNAEMVADVKLAPRLDEEGASCFLSEQGLQRGTFVLDVRDRFRRFDLLIVQTATTSHSCRGHSLPCGSDDADADARIEAGRGVLSRMSAQRDADGFSAAYTYGNPEVIDVARDPVGLRGERDRHARHVHKLSVSELKAPVLAVLAASMWQSAPR